MQYQCKVPGCGERFPSPMEAMHHIDAHSEDDWKGATGSDEPNFLDMFDEVPSIGANPAEEIADAALAVEIGAAETGDEEVAEAAQEHLEAAAEEIAEAAEEVAEELHEQADEIHEVAEDVSSDDLVAAGSVEAQSEILESDAEAVEEIADAATEAAETTTPEEIASGESVAEDVAEAVVEEVVAEEIMEEAMPLPPDEPPTSSHWWYRDRFGRKRPVRSPFAKRWYG